MKLHFAHSVVNISSFFFYFLVDDDAVGCLDTRIRSFEVTLVELDGDRDYHMPVELGGSGGMKKLVAGTALKD
ncbi:hypothetical protein Hanom_Chr02g00158841 [Helianthus anomalus]